MAAEPRREIQRSAAVSALDGHRLTRIETDADAQR